MKNFFFLLVFVLFCFCGAQGQISLQYTFPSAVTNYYFSIIKFGYAGDKYVKVDPANHEIQIYSLTQVLEKDFIIPSSIVGNSYNVWYVSDNLFDLDSSVEYLVLTTLPPFSEYILKEDGSVLFARDTVSPRFLTNPNAISDFTDIYPTTDGTKLIVGKVNVGTEVYSLPGSLPCYECSNGEYTGNFSPSGQSGDGMSLSNPYPNPTNNLTRIDYKLPDGINQGELVFYNTIGNEVKRFKVTSVFSFINVSAHDLPSGTYYYNLQTSAGGSDGKKLVVIR